MKDNLDLILQQLNDIFISVKRCAPDLRSDSQIEFADTQKIIRTGVIYLVSCDQADSFLKEAYIQPGAYLMVSDVAKAGQVTSLSQCDRITVVEFSCRLSTLYNRLTKAISRRFREPVVPDAGLDMNRQEKLLRFWRQIRNQTLRGTVEIKEQLRQLCPELKPYVRLLIVVPEENTVPDDWSAALEQLQSALPGTCLFPTRENTDEQIIGFQFFGRQNFGLFENTDAINAVLKQHSLKLMISNSTRDFGKLNTLYSLTRRAGLIAARLNLQQGEGIYHYERYGMYQVIDLCTQRYMSLFNHSDIMYLVHPVVVHLTRYDEKHRTNLRDVLFYYLQNSQDLQRTAKMLYMHRNTVANKINQIRSICQINFDDGGLCQRLLFGCQVMLYYEKVLQQQLSRNEEPREP